VVVASRAGAVGRRTAPTSAHGNDIEEDLMTEKHDKHEARGERDGEYTDTDKENVIEPEPESGEYTDSVIPGDE
jgi:hypothetical protein